MPPEVTLLAAQSPVQRADSTAALEAGLDALQTVAPADSARRGRVRRAVVPPLVALALALGAWQAYVELGSHPRSVVPAPADVAAALVHLWGGGDVQAALATSLPRGLAGFAAAVLAGTALGLVVARVAVVRSAIGPLFTGLQALPAVAWVPAALLWFGLTDATVYFVVLTGAIPSVVIGLVAGVDQVPPLYRRVGRVLGARRLALVRHVILPAALPGYLAGLRQGWAFAWRALLGAEIIAVGGGLGSGLGALLHEGRERADMAVVMAAVLLILAVGVAVEVLAFRPLERRVLRRRGLRPETAP